MKHNVWHSKNHKKYLLQYHLILVTKYRKPILDDELSNVIKLLSYEICNKNGVKILCMETDKDHIHYMIDAPTNLSIEKLIKLIKSYTTYHVWEKYNLSKHYVFIVGKGLAELIRLWTSCKPLVPSKQWWLKQEAEQL